LGGRWGVGRERGEIQLLKENIFFKIHNIVYLPLLNMTIIFSPTGRGDNKRKNIQPRRRKKENRVHDLP
jgi:hypothetical protein